ncbi:MAG: tRNA pseudouridine(38-40) synthase TruA [Dehalococcoidales bacterium]|nr:tRNA pseudouridine(38-40) synthase TruA [Dehalococcoidales bacterium]
MVLEYQGTNYSGFQYQVNAPTIQETLEKAILKLTREVLRVTASSRTDSGVHAAGQVVSFLTGSNIKAGEIMEGLNYYLPPDIAVKESYKINKAFNVQLDAVSRQYQYRILNTRSRSPLFREFTFQVRNSLDTEVMNEACSLLEGEHDLASFITKFSRSVIKSSIKKVYSVKVFRDGEMVVLDMTAQSFLPHQVRNTAGMLIRIGLKKLDIESFKNILEEKKPGLAGPTAPACGLCLLRVNYPRPLGEYNEDL